jgi:hypothetical protein
LAVVVNDALLQSLGLNVRQAFQCLLARENARFAKSVLASEQIIDLETDSIKRRLPPGVAGNHEGEVVYKMRSILA